jgi:hypothetical protein
MKTDKYRNQAIKKYGKEAVERGEANILKLSTNKFQELILKQKANWEELFQSRFDEPDSPAVQKLIREHHKITATFWGDKPNEESYKGLAESYLQDPRYTTMEGETHKEFAEFLAEAMRYFAEENL